MPSLPSFMSSSEFVFMALNVVAILCAGGAGFLYGRETGFDRGLNAGLGIKYPPTVGRAPKGERGR